MLGGNEKTFGHHSQKQHKDDKAKSVVLLIGILFFGSLLSANFLDELTVDVLKFIVIHIFMILKLQSVAF